MSSQQSSASQASMLAGHAKYVQGTVSQALGHETGKQTRADAVQEMKDAQSSSQTTQSTILGTMEKTVGQITGCQGMEKEGDARIPEKRGVEEQSGTG